MKKGEVCHMQKSGYGSKHLCGKGWTVLDWQTNDREEVTCKDCQAKLKPIRSASDGKA